MFSRAWQSISLAINGDSKENDDTAVKRRRVEHSVVTEPITKPTTVPRPMTTTHVMPKSDNDTITVSPLSSHQEKNAVRQQPVVTSKMRKNDKKAFKFASATRRPSSENTLAAVPPVSLKRTRSKSQFASHAASISSGSSKMVTLVNNKMAVTPSSSSSYIRPLKPSPIRRLTNLTHGEPMKTKKSVLYICPYKWCDRPTFKMKKAFFEHIRNQHYAPFPSFTPDKNCVFQNLSGKTIGFNEQSRDSVLDGQEIYSEDLRIRNFCPYKSCTISEYSRQNLFTHIRDKHFHDFPQFLEFNRLVFKNPLQELIRFDENSRNTINDGEGIKIEGVSKADKPDCYYCPFQECEGGNGILYFSDLYKHFRRIHQCQELPQRQKLATVSRRFLLKTKSGNVLNMTDSKCKDTVDKNETLVIEYIN